MPWQTFWMAFSGEWKMLIKKVLLAVLIAAGAIGAAVTPLPSMAEASLDLNAGPPADRYERAPEPRNGYVWSPGYWDYRNNAHVWVAGTSIQARDGYVYTPRRWAQREGRWNLQPDSWHRPSNP
jgi:WXXGXW repeat (2 copies)